MELEGAGEKPSGGKGGHFHSLFTGAYPSDGCPRQPDVARPPVQVNWGRAMCLRAELAQSDDLAGQLYTSALDKFEAVLEEDPQMVMAKYR